MLRLPPQNIAHEPFMQPLQCDLQPQLQETHRTTPQEQPLVSKHIEGTNRVWNDRSRTRRTHEVPFIIACSHFTRKNTRFRAPASSSTHHLPSSPLPFLTTSLPHHSPSSSLPFFTTSLPHHFPSSPLPFLTTSLLHHSPSSSLPFFTTSLPHHFPSSPLPFLTTTHRHHFPSSPLPIVTTSLHHHPLIVSTLHQGQFHRFLFFCYVLICYVLLYDLPPFIISNLRILFVLNTEVLLPNFL